MNIVSHSRCKKCNKAANVTELELASWPGRICINTEQCKIRLEKMVSSKSRT